MDKHQKIRREVAKRILEFLFNMSSLFFICSLPADQLIPGAVAWVTYHLKKDL